MSLNRKGMVREIGRRTRLPNRDVERMLDALVEVWTEALVSGQRIEIEHFLVLDVHTVEAGGGLAQRRYRRVTARAGRRLRQRLNDRRRADDLLP
jgi:nucleoid DNA-binding protein